MTINAHMPGMYSKGARMVMVAKYLNKGSNLCVFSGSITTRPPSAYYNFLMILALASLPVPELFYSVYSTVINWNKNKFKENL